MFRYLTPDEFETVMRRAAGYEGRTDSEGRNVAGVMLGLHGLRISEVCRLCIRDLDVSRGAVQVDTLKKGNARTVEIKQRLTLWLGLFAAGKPARSPLLRTSTGRRLHPSQLRRSWSRIAQAWIGRKVRFHSLRHTAAQRLYEATEDPLKVQAFLGHRTLAATQIYAQAVGGVREHMPDFGDAKPRLFDAG